MASSLTDDLRCSVCLDFYVDPQMLNCGHNFCLTCVKSCIPSWRDKGKCPECRVPFKQHDYTSNRALGNLAEKARQLVADEESQSGTPLQHICKEHNEPMKLFCKRDLAPACVYCRNQPQHRRHVFLSINRSVDYAEEVLEPYQTWLGNCLKEITKVQKVQQRKTVKMVTCTKEILSHVSRDCEVFRQVLQEKEEKLKKNVEEMKAKNLEELRDALRSIQEVSSLTEMNTQIITESAPAGNCMIQKEKEVNLKKNVEQMKEKNMEVMQDALSSLEEDVIKENVKMKEKNVEVMQDALGSFQDEVIKEDLEMKEKNMEVMQDALSSFQEEVIKEDVEMKEKNMEDALSSLQEEVSKEEVEMKEKNVEVMQDALSSLQEDMSKEDVEMMEKNMEEMQDALNSLKKDVKEMRGKKLEVVQDILCSLQEVSSQTEMSAQFKTICATANCFISLETSTGEILSHISKECMDFCQTLHEKELKLKENVEEYRETENMEEMQDASSLLPEKVPSCRKKKAQITTKCVAVDDYIFLKDFKDLIDRIKQIQPPIAKDKGLKCVRLFRKGGGKWKRGLLFHRGRGWRLGGHFQRGSGACKRNRLLKGGGGGVESQGSNQEKEGGEGTSQ